MDSQDLSPEEREILKRFRRLSKSKQAAVNDRILSALKTGGIQALGQMLNHPFSTFVIAALEDWEKSKDS
jgi:hypothetical protein